MTVVLGGDDACSSLVEDLYTAVFPVFSECLSRMSIAFLHPGSTSQVMSACDGGVTRPIIIDWLTARINPGKLG